MNQNQDNLNHNDNNNIDRNSGNTYIQQQNNNNNSNQSENTDASNSISPLFPSPSNSNRSIDPLSEPSPLNSRFAILKSSPDLDDKSNCFIVASQNVRGLSNTTKFNSILSDFITHDIDIIGLQETHLSATAGKCSFKNYMSSIATSYTYHAYWSLDHTDRASGICLIIAQHVSKYVQRVHEFKGRFIAVDLYLPCKKLKVINIYAPQKADYTTKGKVFCDYVIKHIKDAQRDNFQIIIMGDFNVDPFHYMQYLSAGRSPSNHYRLIDFLSNGGFIDQFPTNNAQLQYATFYAQGKPTSRIDQIWYSDELLRLDYCFDCVWHLPTSQLSPTAPFKLDHSAVMVYFTKHLLLGDVPLHKQKQNGLRRKVYNFKDTNSTQWAAFSAAVDNKLSHDANNVIPAISSTLHSSVVHLNSLWSTLKNATKSAADENLPVKHISNNL